MRRLQFTRWVLGIFLALGIVLLGKGIYEVFTSKDAEGNFRLLFLGTLITGLSGTAVNYLTRERPKEKNEEFLEFLLADTEVAQWYWSNVTGIYGDLYVKEKLYVLQREFPVQYQRAAERYSRFLFSKQSKEFWENRKASQKAIDSQPKRQGLPQGEAVELDFDPVELDFMEEIPEAKRDTEESGE